MGWKSFTSDRDCIIQNASCHNFLPLRLWGMYKRYIDNELSIGMLRKGTVPMHEPTQELIVSELRRRVRVSITELTQVLGPQFASMVPQEIQRMKASGLVV